MIDHTTESLSDLQQHKISLIIFIDVPIPTQYEIIRCDDGKYFDINEDTITFWTHKGMLVFMKFSISGFEIQVS